MAAFAGYLACACITFGHVLQSPFTRVVGVAHLHVWEELWHFWWTNVALTSDQSPFYSMMLGFPGGMNVFYDMSSISLPIVSVPLQAILGVVGTYNLIGLLSLTADWGQSPLFQRRMALEQDLMLPIFVKVVHIQPAGLFTRFWQHVAHSHSLGGPLADLPRKVDSPSGQHGVSIPKFAPAYTLYL